MRLRSFLALCGAALVCGCAASSGTRLDERARSLREAGEMPAAYAAYADALCAEPGRVELALAYVELWDHLGRPGRAEARLSGCRLEPVTEHVVVGLAAALVGDHGAAETALAHAESAASVADRASICQRRGLVALRAGDANAAVLHLSRAASLSPEHVETRLALAQAYVDASNYAAAVETLRGILSLTPAPADLERARRIGRAAVRRSQGPLDPAHEEGLQALLGDLERGVVGEEHTTRAGELLSATRHPRVLTVVGMLALRQGDTPRGTLLLEEAAAVSPLDADPSRALGVSAFAAERYGAAFAPLREAARRDPLDPGTYAMLAEVALKLGKAEAALDAYRVLTALSPRDASNYLWVARLERQLGHVAAARLAAERGRAVQSDNVPLLLERASIEAQLALVAPSESEREVALARTRAAIADLLAVAPNHPGAASIIESVEARGERN